MRIRAAVVEITALPVFHPGQDLALGRTVALELIRDDHPWHVLQALEQRAEKFLRGLLVAPALHQDVEDVVVLVDSTPQVMALPIDRQKDLVNGLSTNDKFCLIRHSQIKLRWSRHPYRFRPRKSQYAPDETSPQGGYHDTPVAETASGSANGRRGTTLGSRLPASP